MNVAQMLTGPDVVATSPPLLTARKHVCRMQGFFNFFVKYAVEMKIIDHYFPDLGRHRRLFSTQH